MNDNMSRKIEIPELHRLAAIVIVFIAILGAYYKTLDNPFLWDDLYLIRDNYFIKDTANIAKLFTREYFTQPVEISFRPLTTLTFIFDYAIWDDHSGGYHLFNLLLHFINSLILLTIISRITRKFALATGMAILFALHPLQTEAVNLVTFREDMLCFLFVGCALLLYIRFRDRGGILALFLSIVSFAAALLSKETAVVFPGIILAYEYFVNEKRSPKAGWGYSILYLLPSLAFLFLRFGPMKGPAENIIYHGNSVFTTFLLMVQAVARYINLIFWPVNQCIDQPFPLDPTPYSSAFMASLFLIFAFVVLTVVFYVKRKPVLFGIIWMVLFFLPVSNIVPIGVIMAERYMYIPLAGFFISMAYILELLFLSDERPLAFANAKVLAVLVVIVAGAFMLTTIDRNNVWETRITFWEDACYCSPTSARSAVNLGIAYLEDNQLDKAAETLIRAVRISSSGKFEDVRYGTLYRGLSNLGIVAARKGLMKTAVKFFTEAAEIKPNAPLTHLNLGIALMKMGRLADAEQSFRRCLSIAPANQHAHLYLAVILQQTRRREEAIQHCDAILDLHPESKRAMRLKQHLIWEQQNLND